jgi:hypothetical protein
MMTNNFQFILDALEVGLEIAEDDDHPEVVLDKPHILEGLQPPVSVRAVVTIDGEPYEVYIKAAEPGEAHEPSITE